MYYIGIDPGVHNHAFAVLDEKACVHDLGFIKTDNDSVHWFLRFYNNYQIAIEMPDKIERAIKVNDIIRLVRSAEKINTIAELLKIDVRVTPVREWKGSVPKEVTKNRVRECVSDKKGLIEKVPLTRKNHIYDALGLALWLLCAKVSTASKGDLNG